MVPLLDPTPASLARCSFILAVHIQHSTTSRHGISRHGTASSVLAEGIHVPHLNLGATIRSRLSVRIHMLLPGCQLRLNLFLAVHWTRHGLQGIVRA